jgi:iron complex outermembrane receptor protein
MKTHIFIAVWFLFAGALQAQSTNTLSGTVSDPSGLPIARASVLLQGASQGAQKRVQTGAAGEFVIPAVAAGSYKLMVSSAGFETKEVAVAVGSEPAPIHVRLNVSAVSSSVLVMATRSEVATDQQPAATSLVTVQDIQERNVQTLDQSLDTVPGLYQQRDKGPADTLASTFLRGFNGADRTLVLLDGQPINDPFSGSVTWTSLPIDEVQSIEVVRGPFSSLYGGNAMGGVINVLTRPATRREFDLYGEYGGYDTTRYSARFSDRFWNKLGISVGYQRLQFGGYNSAMMEAYPGEGTGPVVTGAVPTVDTYGNQVFIVGDAGRNWAEQYSYYAKGDYAFTDATVLNFEFIRQDYGYGYNMYHSYLQTASGTVVDNGTFLANYNGTLQPISVVPSSYLQDAGNLHSNFVAGSLLHKFSANRFLRFDGSYYDTPNSNYRTPDYLSTASGGTGTYTNAIAHSFHGNAQFNQRIRRQTIVVGTEARRDGAENPAFAMSNWTLPSTLEEQNYASLGRSFNDAVYAQDELSLTEHLHVLVGGRYEYWRTYDGLTNGYTTSQPLTFFPNRSENSLTGKIGATYGLPGDWTLRASLGSAFRNPTIFELYSSFSFWGMTFAGNPYLSPEHDRSFEFGAEKRIGTRTNFDADYFQNNISGLIYYEPNLIIDPSGDYLDYVNAARGRTRGAEAALRTRLLSWLMFRASYTYTNAIITSNPAEPDSVGKHVPNIPDTMFSGQFLTRHRRWTGSLTGRYAGATFSQDNNSDVVKGVPGAYDPYFLLGASVGYKVNSRLQLFTSGENLLDRRYYLNYLAAGRAVYGGLRLKF